MTSVPFLNRIIADDVKETQYMVLLRGAIIPRQLEMLDPSNSLQSLKRVAFGNTYYGTCLLYTSPSPRDATLSRMPSSA